MSNESTSSVLSRKALTVAASVTLGLLWAQYSGAVARAVAPSGIAGLPYSRSFLASVSDILVLLLLLSVVARVRVTVALRVIGLHRPPLPAIVSFAALFAGAVILCMVLLPISETVTFSDLVWLGVGGPLTEEIAYRGLAVGSLMLLAGWRFVPAAILPGLLFGVAHAGQGTGVAEVAGVVAITMVGGVLFGWLYVRWGFNLWPAIVAHVGLNLLWSIFALGESAIGGWFGNALRASLVILMVAVTLWLSPRGDPLQRRGEIHGHRARRNAARAGQDGSDVGSG